MDKELKEIASIMRAIQNLETVLYKYTSDGNNKSIRMREYITSRYKYFFDWIITERYSMKKKPKKEVTVKAWAGIVSGHIDRHLGEQYGYSEKPTLRAVFTNKKQADKRYTRVIPCTITYIV